MPQHTQHTQHKATPLEKSDWKSDAAGKQIHRQQCNIAANGTAAAHECSTVQSGSTTAAATGGAAAARSSTSKPSLLLKAAALTATFAVSGLMHELVLYLCNDTDGYRFGFWFAFFVVQAPLLVVEGLALQRLRKAGLQVPKAVGITYNTFFVLLTAYLFWYPPLESHSNIAEYVVQCINGNVQGVTRAVQQLVQQLAL